MCGLSIVYNVATLGRRRTRAMEIFAPAVARGLLWIFGIRLRIHGREHCEYGAATMHLRLRVARELARFPGPTEHSSRRRLCPQCPLRPA